MGKVQTLKKLKKYARKEARNSLNALSYETALLKLLKPKPKYLPWWAWSRIVNLVLKSENAQSNTTKIHN